MGKLQVFGTWLSLNDQYRLVVDSYFNLINHGEYGQVTIKPNIKYYIVYINNTTTYRVDKTGRVFNFYKRPVGTIDDLIRKESDRNAMLLQQIKKLDRTSYLSKIQPKVVIEGKKEVPKVSYLGKVFTYSYGYDMTINEYVQVVSETAKQVQVVKLKKIRSGNEMNGTGRAVASSTPYSKPFTLLKSDYRGELALRGSDKSEYGSSESHLWTLDDGKPRYENHSD